MARASFKTTTAFEKATHFKTNSGREVWWKVRGTWYRMFSDGSCGNLPKDVVDAYGTPDTLPEAFEPCFGDLTITIKGDN